MSPANYLDTLNSEQLHEVKLLLQISRYQIKMYPDENGVPKNLTECNVTAAEGSGCLERAPHCAEVRD